MNLARGTETDRAMLKRDPFRGGFVQGRAETFREARIALRIAMVRHVEDGHPDQ